MSDCIFCKIAEKQIPSALVYEDNDVVAFEDLNPQAPTHVLIIPRKHISRISDAGPEDAEMIGKLHLVANRIAADRGFASDGYRLVINCNESAGQTVWHVHLHLLGGRTMTWPPG